MVGRDRELARVTGLLDDALAGRGRLVLCTGEAGIGKTRLAEELAAAATARGVSTPRTALDRGFTWDPSSCRPGWRPRRWGAWTRRFATWRRRCRSATPTVPADTPYRRASNWPPPWPAGGVPVPVSLSATFLWRRRCWTPRLARPSSSAWFRSPSGSTSCG